jgi:hypothetical protein
VLLYIYIYIKRVLSNYLIANKASILMQSINAL